MIKDKNVLEYIDKSSKYAFYLIDLINKDLKKNTRDDKKHKINIIIIKDEYRKCFTVKISITKKEGIDTIHYYTLSAFNNLPIEKIEEFDGDYYNATILGKKLDSFTTKDAKKDFLETCNFKYLKDCKDIEEDK